jgi:hypothetical protein
MTETKAILCAQGLAATARQTLYVVYDPAYRDETPHRAYHVCDEAELDTFFAGCPIVAVIEPA